MTTSPLPGRLLLMVGLVAASVACTSPATHSTARSSASPPPSTRFGPPRMIAAPSRGLADRARVALTLAGFRPEEKVFLTECGPGQKPSRLVGCGRQAAAEPFTITDARGARVGTVFPVAARVHGQQCLSSCVIAAVGNGELVTVRIAFRSQSGSTTPSATVIPWSRLNVATRTSGRLPEA